MKVPKWKLIAGYNHNDLFKDFGNETYTKEDFIAKGDELYDLRKSTCRQKLYRGVKQGLVVKIGSDLYKTNF